MNLENRPMKIEKIVMLPIHVHIQVGKLLKFSFIIANLNKFKIVVTNFW